jgi:uncharacterized membrane protein
MASHPHYAKATIAGHPIHAMLVGFPIAFYSAGVATTIAYAATSNLFWFRVAMISLIVAVIGAGVAAVFGLVDLFGGIPKDSPARRSGYIHLGLNLVTLALFLIAAIGLGVGWNHYRETGALPSSVLPLVLQIIGVPILLAAGFFGWKLVQTHHVGVDETTGDAISPTERATWAETPVMPPQS